jgi:hypothetical protein
MITVIKIDVKHRAILRIDIGKTLTDFYQHIGCNCMEAVRVAGLVPTDRLYVDEEGLLTPGKAFFLIEGYAQPLAGNGLIVGHNDEGESVSAATPLGKVWPRIQFLEGIST